MTGPGELDARRRATLVGGLRRYLPAEPPAPVAAPRGRRRLRAVPDRHPGEHKHLIHLDERRIVCVCATCWALRSGDAEFRPVGNRRVWLEDFALTDEQWAAFGSPIGLAFLMISSVSGERDRALPEPGGGDRVRARPGGVGDVCAANPELELEPDSEALVVNRLGETPQHMIVADRRRLRAGRRREVQLGGHLGRRRRRRGRVGT